LHTRLPFTYPTPTPTIASWSSCTVPTALRCPFHTIADVVLYLAHIPGRFFDVDLYKRDPGFISRTTAAPNLANVAKPDIASPILPTIHRGVDPFASAASALYLLTSSTSGPFILIFGSSIPKLSYHLSAQQIRMGGCRSRRSDYLSDIDIQEQPLQHGSL